MSEKQYGGLLAALSEACDIKVELGVSVEEAFVEQRRRQAERMAEYEASKADANVIYGVDFGAGGPALNDEPDPEAA